MAIKEEDVPKNRFMLGVINQAVTICGFADSDVGALTTWAGTSSTTALEGVIRAKTVLGQYERLREQIADQVAKVAVLGLSDNTELAAAASVADVRTLFTDNDSNATGSAYTTFAWPV